MRHEEGQMRTQALIPPAANGTSPITVSRALLLLRGGYRAHGLTLLDLLRGPGIRVGPQAQTDHAVNPARDEGSLELRAGVPHQTPAIVEIVRELARRAARKWYASLEQNLSVEDPA